MLDPSLFISAQVESRVIKLADKSSHTLYFRHLPIQQWELFAIQSNSHDETVSSMAAARLVAAGLCDAQGKEALTVDQVCQLKRPVFRRIFEALLEVNAYTRAGAARTEDEAGKA